MKKIVLLCAALLALAANAQNVYRPYREFVYKVTISSRDSEQVSYLSMWTTGNTWAYDTSQKELFYAYHNHYNKDSLAAAWPYQENVESTGMIENERKIWLHPPRSGMFSMLEYFPFPELKRQAKCGSKYRRSFLGHIDFLGKTVFLSYKMKANCDEVDDLVIVSGVAKHKSEHWQTLAVWDEKRCLFWYGCEIVPNTQIGIYFLLEDIVEHN